MEIFVSKWLYTQSRRQGNILLPLYTKTNGENAIEYNNTGKSKGAFPKNHDPRPGYRSANSVMYQENLSCAPYTLPTKSNAKASLWGHKL